MIIFFTVTKHKFPTIQLNIYLLVIINSFCVLSQNVFYYQRITRIIIMKANMYNLIKHIAQMNNYCY